MPQALSRQKKVDLILIGKRKFRCSKLALDYLESQTEAVSDLVSGKLPSLHYLSKMQEHGVRIIYKK